MKWLVLVGCLLAGAARAGVSRDANGWTDVTVSGDSRVVYVSSLNGNDGDDGLTTGNAKASLSAGYGLMRDGFPDHLLIEKGSTFATGFPTWNVDGRSATEPMLIGTYGTGARPIVKSHLGFPGGTPMSYVAITGIDFYDTSRDPSHGDYVAGGPGQDIGIDLNSGTWVLIEDCRIRFHKYGINVEGINSGASMDNATIRRNVITDNHSTTSAHGQGIFADKETGLVIEENVIDHNGWVGSSRCTVDTDGCPTSFNHNVYAANSSSSTPAAGSVIFQNNLSSNASSHGFQRPDGSLVYNNLFLDNPLAMEPQSLISGSLVPTISYNVINGTADINTDLDRGTALKFGVINALGITIDHNLVIHATGTATTTNDFGASSVCCNEDFDGSSGSCGVPGTCTNVNFSSNIWYDWSYGCPHDFSGSSSGTYSNNIYWDTASHCTPSGSNLNGEAYSFYDNTRDVGTYASAVLGLAGTHAAFVAAARAQSRDTWDPRLQASVVNAWIREGFFGPPGIKGATLSGASVR